MLSKELFDFVCKGNIEKSLYSTCIFLIENSNIEVLEETLISICSHIGTFINIREISKLNDICISTKNLIYNETINVSDYLILITKMCILCNTYNINPVHKTGVIPITNLREKILDVFSDDFKLSTNGIMKFEMIIPPTDSDAYLLSLRILSAFVKLIKIVEDIPTEDSKKIEIISIKFKNCFDYIIRKKYVIQTKLNPNEYDPIYFLWGFIEILYQHEPFINVYFNLFSHNYKKTLKMQRIGLIYASSVSIIYSHKRSMSISWNQDELNVMQKTKEISNELMKQVKKDLNIRNPEPVEKEKDEKKKLDGMSYINNYIPKIQSNLKTSQILPFEDEYKTIIN